MKFWWDEGADCWTTQEGDPYQMMFDPYVVVWAADMDFPFTVVVVKEGDLMQMPKNWEWA